METKYCGGCKTRKPIEEFHLDASRPDGHRYWCRLCHSQWHNAYQARRYQEDPDYRQQKILAGRERNRRNSERNAADPKHRLLVAKMKDIAIALGNGRQIKIRWAQLPWSHNTCRAALKHSPDPELQRYRVSARDTGYQYTPGG